MDSGNSKVLEAQRLYGRLETSIFARNFESARAFLNQLKVKLTEFSGLPPLYRHTSTQVEELKLARSILEQAVLLSVGTEDQESFELHFLQLKPYYTDTRHLIPPSNFEYIMLGLNLLRLLVQNRIAEFHTELELLSPEALKNDCIKIVVELEQALMEGAYNHVLRSRKVPHDSYNYFINLLAKTVRDEISGCSEKAYDFLTLDDAKTIFKFTRDQDLMTYISEEHPDWEIRNRCVYFQKVKDFSLCKEIPSLQLINQTLGYARELERIV
ncbi:hypothetical protein SELMODRAFT_271572 [Selaginella moellendorffii]|uniref:PCI domain-containing protein n=1 Tax=Selaginella moellendorffii TaxID=88036 RepID=D8SH36_SELML|nr:26S proteasome non-ATPase regulatory subunit 8 homolog A [Selaginella moellendorffii]EFJ16454.1 hypothetical protein SELMODRAFT_271572 [Selaginella moellendorffii]|eukprot:XP_002982701.1 26S proteasome non-ATPase regulatory subunit 8 homolog A [Selaginella moellendorffii]